MDNNGPERESGYRPEMHCDQRDLYSGTAVDDGLQIKPADAGFFVMEIDASM